MGFTAPLLLWGALIAAAPWLIHLLFRRRFREIPWGAMQFLAAATQRQSRWSRIDQWLLLLIRTVIPLFAALALAGPLLDRVVGASGSVPVHRVLALDVSLSTQASEEGRTRWSRIRDAAADIVALGKPGDTWQLLALGGTTPRKVIAEPTFQSAPVLEELKQLEPTAETGNIADGLAALLAALPEDGPSLREVHLLTDAQRTQWHPEAVQGRELLREQMSELADRARILWMDASGQSLGNAAITDVSLAEPYVMIGEPLRALATVRRFGETPPPASLEWRVDDRLVAVQPLDFPDGAEARTELTYTPSTSGELRIEARIPADALPVDDRRYAVCVARSVIRLLLVDGRPSGIPFENATDYLRLALAPQMSAGISGRMEPTVISDGQLPAANLEEYDVVFLCDVPQLTEREGALLTTYVQRGGGLVIGLGPAVRPETYQEALSQAGRELLPARIGELVGDARQRETAFAFLGAEFRHPILAPFRGNPNTGFELTQTFAYRRLLPSPAAEVAVAFDSGDPAIVAGRFGRGRVLLLATAVDRTWGTWAVWGHTFVPMMHEIVRYLMSGQLESRQLTVGAPIMAVLPRSANGTAAQVRTPAGQQRGISASDTGADGTLIFEETRDPGFYAVERTGAAVTAQWYAVNPAPAESDLTPLSMNELREGLFSGRPVDAPLDPGVARPASIPGVLDHSLTRWLLGTVLILLIGEPLLAWQRPLALLVIAGLVVVGLGGVWLGTTGAVLAAAGCTIVGLVLSTRTGSFVRSDGIGLGDPPGGA